MKGTFLLFALLLPMSVAAQASSPAANLMASSGPNAESNFESSSLAGPAAQPAAQSTAKPVAADLPEKLLRYEVFAGVDYSGDNQVKSASALIGGNVGLSAKLVKWFGATVDFGDYGKQATSVGLVKPNQTTFLAGPEFYIPADNITGFVHVLMGGAHTGGVPGTPDVSFAVGGGGGFEYTFHKRLALRISGDGIRSSFQAESGGVNYASPHPHTNARASAGIAWHF